MSLLEKLDDLVHEQHTLDTNVPEDVIRRAKEAPLYLQDLQHRAAKQGKSLSEILADDREMLANSSYPLAECLKSDEVLAVSTRQDLPAERRRHYEDCVYCQAVVATSMPDEKMVTEMASRLAAEGQEKIVQPIDIGFVEKIAVLKAAISRLLHIG